MTANISKITLAVALGLITGLTGPAMAGGGWTKGSQLCFSNCGAKFPPPAPPAPRGTYNWNFTDGFGKQPTTTNMNNSGWNHCPGC
jgi:hypothetical protein